MLISAQDRCAVCTECTMGMEIVLGVPDGSLGLMGQVEARFSPFGDSVNLGGRYLYGLHRTHHRLRN